MLVEKLQKKTKFTTITIYSLAWLIKINFTYTCAFRGGGVGELLHADWCGGGARQRWDSTKTPVSAISGAEVGQGSKPVFSSRLALA